MKTCHPSSSSTPANWRHTHRGVNLRLRCKNPSCRLSKVGSHWRPVGFGVEVDLLQRKYGCKECESPSKFTKAAFRGCIAKFDWKMQLRTEEIKIAQECPTSDVADESLRGSVYDEMDIADFMKKNTPSRLRVMCTLPTTSSDVDKTFRESEETLKQAEVRHAETTAYEGAQEQRALQSEKELFAIIGAKPDMDAIRAQVEEAVDDPQQKRRATVNVVAEKGKALAAKEKLRLLKEKETLQKADAEARRKKLKAKTSIPDHILAAKKQVEPNLVLCGCMRTWYTGVRSD